MNGDVPDVIGGCANCGSTVYVINWEVGSSVCNDCGCVQETHLRVGGEGYRATHDLNGNRIHNVGGYETTLAGAYIESVADYLASERATYRVQSPPYR